MKERILTKNFCFSFLSLFASSMVMYILMGTITEYVSDFGTTATLAGLVSGIYVVGGMFSRFCSGKMLDSMGWKKMGLMSTLLHFVACCFYPFVSSLPLLILVRFIHGIGFGMSSSAIVTIGMSILPKSRFGEAGGYFMMGTTLSVGLGPYVGGFVYDTFGATGCFALAIIMSFLTGVFLIFVDLSRVEQEANASAAEDNAGKEQKFAFLRKFIEPGAIPIAMIISLCGFGYVSLLSFYRLYAEQTNLTQEFSYFFLIYAGCLLILRPAAGIIQDKYGNKWVCIPGIIAQTVGLFLISFQPCMITLIICALGCAMGYGSLTSACNVMICRKAPLSRRSYAVTTFYLCCDIAMGFGPALLGAVANAANYHFMYYTASALTLIALPLFLIINKKEPSACSPADH